MHTLGGKICFFQQAIYKLIKEFNLFGITQKMKDRSEVEHFILFSGIALAVIKCLCSDKFINIGLSMVSSYIVAVCFLISFAVVVKILYHLQFIIFTDKDIYRSRGDKGLFCIVLLPTALIFTCISHWTLLSDEFKYLTLISLELALSSFIIMSLHCSVQQNYFHNIIFAIVSVTCVTNGVLILHGLHNIKCTLLSLISKCIFFWLLDAALICSQSFTMGELNLVCQFIVTFLASALIYFNAVIFGNDMYSSNANSMIFIALSGLLVVLFLLKIFPMLRSTFCFYLACIGIGGVSILVIMSIAFKENPFLWFVTYVSKTKSRLLLMLYWGICSGLTFLFVLWQQTRFEQSNTVNRKFFHGVVLAIYIPGFVFDPELLLLASSLIFGIFVLLECVRVLNIFPLGDIIQNAFCVFLDEKDSGMLMLTHLYLFLGCSVTLWIHPFKEISHICITSGILAVGFGDSAASIAGTYFGKRKWPHTKKSYEGTVTALVIQLLGTLFMLMSLKHVPSLLGFLFILLATAHSVLLETFTTQVDNLVLPFYLYTMIVCL